MYIIIFIIIVIIILLFMNTRVKVIFDQGYLSVYIYKIRILKLKKNETKEYAYENFMKYKFKATDLKYLDILKSIDFRKISIRLCLLEKDYYTWAILYGTLNAILSLPITYFKEKNITYYYHIDFYNKPYVKFESIFYFKLGKILINTIKIRRKIHGKRASNS